MMDLVQTLQGSIESGQDQAELAESLKISSSRIIKDCDIAVAMLNIMLEYPAYRRILISQDQFNTVINILQQALERYRVLIKAPAVLPKLQAVYYELESSDAMEAEDALPPEGTPEVEGGHPEAGALYEDEAERRTAEDEHNREQEPQF